MSNNYNSSTDIMSPGGLHGMGGGWLIGALIIFFLLFRDGFGHRGRDEGHGGDRNRNRDWFPDESNRELEGHLQTQFCRLNDRVEKEGAETRGLITQNTIQDLRDKVAEKDMIINRQHSEAFTLGLFNRLEGRIETLARGLPKARPQYAQTVTPCLGNLPSCGVPRRNNCDLDFED